jgi:methylenetetrahydrofolate reductase (NADPH)
MPVWPYEQVARFSEKCGADVPAWIRKRMEGYRDDPDSQFELAVEIAVQQAEELFRNGAPGIHFYTLNHPAATVRICEHLFARQQVSHGFDWEDAVYGDVEVSGMSSQPST